MKINALFGIRNLAGKDMMHHIITAVLLNNEYYDPTTYTLK